MIKKEKLLLILNHRLTNIRHDHLHHITSEIVKREPSFICIEDLNVKGMMKTDIYPKQFNNRDFMNLGGRWNINLSGTYSGDHCRSIFFQVLNYAVVVERSKRSEVIRTYLQM